MIHKYNVGKLLIWAYAYYYQHTSLVSDEVFDACLRYVIDSYNSIEHLHKHLIDPTCNNGLSYIKEEDYPNIVKETTQSLLRKSELTLIQTKRGI
jgi:hypothetical protein